MIISCTESHTRLAQAFLDAGLEMGYTIQDYNGAKQIGKCLLVSSKPTASIERNEMVDSGLCDFLSTVMNRLKTRGPYENKT